MHAYQQRKKAREAKQAELAKGLESDTQAAECQQEAEEAEIENPLQPPKKKRALNRQGKAISDWEWDPRDESGGSGDKIDNADEPELDILPPGVIGQKHRDRQAARREEGAREAAAAAAEAVNKK